MSFNKNIAQYLINAVEFSDPKLKDALSKIIEGLDDAYKDVVDIKKTLTNSGISSTSIIPTIQNGNWVPIDASGAGLTFIYSLTSRWIKIGSFVSVIADLQYPVTASGANAQVSGLPFLNSLIQANFQPTFTDYGAPFYAILNTGSKTYSLFINTVTGAAITNAGFSNKILRFSTFYFTNE